MESNLLDISNLVERDEIGFSSSEVVNQVIAQSNQNALIELLFPQSHKLLDLTTLEFGFKFNKPNGTADNRTSISDMNDLFHVVDIKYNQNSLLPRQYQQYFSLFANWMKYSVKYGKRNRMVKGQKFNLSHTNVYDKEKSIIGENSVGLIKYADASVTNGMEYRFVKLSELCPQLAEIGVINLLNGSFSIELRLQNPQYAYGVVDSDSITAVKNKIENLEYSLTDFQIYRKYSHLKTGMDIQSLNQVLNRPIIHNTIIQDRFSMTGTFNKHRVTLTHQGVMGVLAMFTPKNVSRRDGLLDTGFSFTNPLTLSKTGQFLPFHHTLAPQLKDVYFEYGGKRFNFNNQVNGQQAISQYYSTLQGLNQLKMDINIDLDQFMTSRHFVFIPVNVDMLDNALTEQGSIGTFTIELQDTDVKYISTNLPADSVTPQNFTELVEVHLFIIVQQTLIGSQIHKDKLTF